LPPPWGLLNTPVKQGLINLTHKTLPLEGARLDHYCHASKFFKNNKVMFKSLKLYTMYMNELALWRRITAGILLLVPWVFYMVYPAYNMAKPELGGVPFFYWFQTLWLVITAVLSLIGVLLLYPSKR